MRKIEAHDAIDRFREEWTRERPDLDFAYLATLGRILRLSAHLRELGRQLPDGGETTLTHLLFVRRDHITRALFDGYFLEGLDLARTDVLASIAIATVKNASVVVMNPTHIACALRYEEEEGDEAPAKPAARKRKVAR